MNAIVAPAERLALAAAEWRLQARCKGEVAEQFYPPDKERAGARHQRESHAKRICLTCPVLEPCRRYAVDTQEPYGVWGATTPRDRERLLNGVSA